MGLETTTYISGLTSTWPLAGDTKSQGDDHIRLLKATLQSTFPTATKPFYFPTAEAVSANQTLDATDQNNTMYLDTTAGSLTVTLPTLAAADKGWKCDIVKSSTDTNAIVVSPPSGSIVSKVGSTATIRVGVAYEPATFVWTGTTWVCHKLGAVIGQVMSFDGGTTPSGFLDLDGSVYSNTSFAELFAVLATTTLRDRRGRGDIGSGTGTGLTARTAGTNYGAETQQLAVTHLPAETPAGTIGGSATSSLSSYQINTSGNNTYAGGGTGPSPQSNQGSVTVPAAGLTFAGTPFPGRNATAFGLLQPSIAAKRIIRAC